jgi:transcriptional regulator with XRE-family HTH domain
MGKEQINTRVLTALAAVLDAHKELTKTGFAQLLGIKPSTFTEILKGRMNAGSDLMALLTSNFGVSATWLLVGTGDMFTKETPGQTTSGDPLVDRLLHIIDKKDELIRQQAEDIGQLREQLAQLKARLQKSADAASTEVTAHVG